MTQYNEFLAQKALVATPVGFDPAELSEKLFDYQTAVVRWALRLGRAAIFAGTGLGKTAMQVEWARRVHDEAGEAPILIVAPLAVSTQTIELARETFGYEINLCKDGSDVRDGLNVTNYERLDRFDLDDFIGIVLDESSILKSHDGATRTALIESVQSIPYRLCCTATPAPNDFMELGNHSEFLGVMKRSEMLSMFFLHDGGETQKWRLKGHAEEPFWKWLCSWSVMFDSPADLGFDGSRFVLPPLNMHPHIVESTKVPEGMLFAPDGQTLGERQTARRNSIEERVKECAEIVNAKPDEAWLVWCDLNSEGDALTAAIPGAVQVSGSDSPEHKEKTLLAFAHGDLRVLVSKPSICGLGMNLQRCSNMAFVGLSDSFEKFYQAIRRCWRFGQTREVNCHVIYSTAEGSVVSNLKRKEADAAKMRAAMVKHMQVYTHLAPTGRDTIAYEPPVEMRVPEWLVAA